MADTNGLAVLWTVILARFLLPLAIPRLPLPAILACFVLDGVDQTIFQSFTTLNLDFYQGYDKALDIYYLTIAYIATFRNWTNYDAFRGSRFLFYYRLVGVVLFELSQLRWLLLVFPNTFEYFFIFYETVRLRWDAKRLARRTVIGAVAFIWIVIKLPQEYWIHIAQLDATDFIKTTLFGVPQDTSWSQTIAAAPWALGVTVVALAALLVGVWAFITWRLPPADHPPRLPADPLPRQIDEARERRALIAASPELVNTRLIEKIALVTFVSIIFAQILPGAEITPLSLFIGTVIIITINTALSYWLALRRVGWMATLVQFVVMLGVNFGIVIVFNALLPRLRGSLDLVSAFFFVTLLTLIVTLYDWFRTVYTVRFHRPY